MRMIYRRKREELLTMPIEKRRAIAEAQYKAKIQKEVMNNEHNEFNV